MFPIIYLLSFICGATTFTTKTTFPSFHHNIYSHNHLQHSTKIMSLPSPQINSKANSNEEQPTVTIFSITNCKFCTKAKSLLTSKSIPYQEINIEYYPDKRNDMLQLSNSFTVPQIFFGNTLIGGCTDLEAWFDTNESLKDYISIEVDDRLLMPTYPPIVPKEEPLLRKEESFKYLKHLLQTDDSSDVPEYVQIADMLASELPLTSINGHKKVFSDDDLKQYLGTIIHNETICNRFMP